MPGRETQGEGGHSRASEEGASKEGVRRQYIQKR